MERMDEGNPHDFGGTVTPFDDSYFLNEHERILVWWGEGVAFVGS